MSRQLAGQLFQPIRKSRYLADVHQQENEHRKDEEIQHTHLGKSVEGIGLLVHYETPGDHVMQCLLLLREPGHDVADIQHK